MRTPFLVSLVFLGCILLGLGSSVHAQDARTFLDTAFTPDGTLTPALQAQLSQATAQFQQLPAPLQSVFGNQRIKVDLTRADGTVETLGIVLENNQVLDVVRHAPENPTLLLQTDEATVNQLATSPDIGSALLNQVNTGKLRYQGLDAGTSVVTFIASILLWITNLIAGIAHLFNFK